MTDNTSLINLALQGIGTRTTVTAAELTANSTNEAIQANLTFANTRDGLFRMAPWNCSTKTANLTYITSAPGTPENTSATTNLWRPGQPRPPWAYEYQYPVGCLRPCWIIPASQTGFTGVPITTAVTGGAANTWLGGPIVFKVGTDQFLMVTTPTVVTPGTGYAIGDVLTPTVVPAVTETTNKVGTFSIGAPQGAPAQFVVDTINGSGGILTASVINQVIDGSPGRGGSYFFGYQATPTFSTDGSGTGAVLGFDLATSSVYDQRVIYTNQEFATLVFCHRVSDPNVWDPLFQDAFQNALAADLCMALVGDKGLANAFINKANNSIREARTADGNEGLTINDVTPDWIRVRGYGWDTANQLGPYSNFDWGAFLPSYG
jgi:hypothetical protein